MMVIFVNIEMNILYQCNFIITTTGKMFGKFLIALYFAADFIQIIFASVETVNAAYECFDGANAVYSKPDRKKKVAEPSTSSPIYAMPDKKKPPSNLGDVYAKVNTDTKKGNVNGYFLNRHHSAFIFKTVCAVVHVTAVHDVSNLVVNDYEQNYRYKHYKIDQLIAESCALFRNLKNIIN